MGLYSNRTSGIGQIGLDALSHLFLTKPELMYGSPHLIDAEMEGQREMGDLARGYAARK